MAEPEVQKLVATVKQTKGSQVAARITRSRWLRANLLLKDRRIRRGPTMTSSGRVMANRPDAIVALSTAWEYQAAEYVRPWRRSREL